MSRYKKRHRFLNRVVGPGGYFAWFMSAYSRSKYQGMVLLVYVLGAMSSAWASNSDFVTFDPSHSVRTEPFAINQSGVIAGSYFDINDRQYGFVRSLDGTITSLTVPGSTHTIVTSINQSGVTTGYSFKDRSFLHCFVRDALGNIVLFNIAGSANTTPVSINSSGHIAGYYVDVNNTGHGFIRDPSGTITEFELHHLAPNAYPYTAGINDRGVIAGSYFDESTGALHGFIRDASGVITSFDPPGSVSTDVKSINFAGAITGNYYDGNAIHGFVRGADGTISSFDPLGSIHTELLSINNADAITGIYIDSNNETHAFLYNYPRGTIIRLNALGVGESNSTNPAMMNDLGVITGNYRDLDNRMHGFYLRPLR